MTSPTTTTSRSRILQTVAAAAVIVLLGGLLVVRLMARDGGVVVPPHGDVPAPAAFTLSSLEVPCWSCPGAANWKIRFRTDLDLLAPLGDGPANAATFFVQFEKTNGPRAAEAAAFMARRAAPVGVGDFNVGDVVPPDDPLLLEAEPWVDQATMRFYPDLLPINGANTPVPNLLFMIALARSWTARGVAAADTAAGLDDCRRAIRIGRLLRQEDAVMINDLVGLACIHIGTRGVYEIAQHTGDARLALLASVVIGEVAPQRMYTSQRITSVSLTPFLAKSSSGAYTLSVPDARLDTIVEMATKCPDRRFKGEALLNLRVVETYGTPPQQERARKAIDGVIAGGAPVMSQLARSCRATRPEESMLEQMAHEIQ
jgi:hypothetical protein